MAQLVTRITSDLEQEIDSLIAAGVVESRSDAVRRGLEILIDRHRRRVIADQIIAGYSKKPQLEAEFGWADAAALRMIGEEPW